MANTQGKGRDDLTADILYAAEEVSRKVSNAQSTAVRKLAENIKHSFVNLRLLLRKYSENIEVVDPQLRNNQELTDMLTKYERTWEKGKAYFLDKKLCS